MIYFSLCVLHETFNKRMFELKTQLKMYGIMSKDVVLQVSMKCCGFARFASITKVLVVLSLRILLVNSLVDKSEVRLTQELLVSFPESITR